MPHDATQAANGTVFVANELGGTVSVVRGSDVVKVFTDSVQPAGLAPVGDFIGFVEFRKKDLTVYDADKLTIVGSAPAGAGPTHLLADRHGSMIAPTPAVTRSHVRTPTDAAPSRRRHAARWTVWMAYDPKRDRVWVTSSGPTKWSATK